MIEAIALTKRRGRRLAVDNLSFQAPAGRVTGLLGPEGAGKSTTIRLMLQLIRGEGQALFDGLPYRKLDRPMFEVGVMLQDAPMHPGRTINAHFRMLAVAGGFPYRRADDVLELVGLTDVADRRPKNLSRPVRLRLGLAAALMGEPRALILDEPAAGLDPQDIRWLGDLLAAYAHEGRTVLIAGREPAVLGQLADHLVVIDAGRLLADEPSAQFMRRSPRSAVVVRSPHIERLVDVLTAEGASVVREEATSAAATGLTVEQIGELAFHHRLLLHELSERPAGLIPVNVKSARGSVADEPAASPDAAGGTETGTIAQDEVAQVTTGTCSPVFEVTSVGSPRWEPTPDPARAQLPDSVDGERPDEQDPEACELAAARRPS